MSVPLRINRTNTDPTVNDDETLGHQVGWAWFNSTTGNFFICRDPTESEAIWDLKSTAVQGTFPPTVLFNGLSVGLTYVEQVANYVKIGPLVVFNINITLSAKGTSVGNLTIQGLPFLNGARDVVIRFVAENLQLSLTYNAFKAVLRKASNIIDIFQEGSLLGLLNCTDVHVRNTSKFILSGSYFV